MINSNGSPIKPLNLIDRLKATRKEYPVNFMFFLILAMAIPRIYRMTNTYWVGQIDLSSLAIAEQYEFVGIIIEIINETLPFGVLALVSQNYRNRSNIIKQLGTGVLLQIFLSTGLAAVIFFNMPLFVEFIGTAPELVTQTRSYLSLRTLALPFASLSLILTLGLKSMDKAKQALGVVVFNVIANMLLDLYLISNFPFSLRMGVQGVAWGYLVSNVLSCFVAFILTIWTLKVKKNDMYDLKMEEKSIQLFKVGGWTGLDSVVRNFFYFFVLQILNFMGPNQYAGFNLFQMIMWTALIPILAIAEGTKIRIGNYLFSENAREKINNILFTSCTLAFLIIGGFGVFGLFAINKIGYIFSQNPDVVHFSTIMFYWQIIPYILFAISENLRAIFFGTGKTYYILIASLVLNLGIIYPFFQLMNNGILSNSYETIMLMYVLIDLIDIIMAYVFVRHLLGRLFPKTTM